MAKGTLMTMSSLNIGGRNGRVIDVDPPGFAQVRRGR